MALWISQELRLDSDHAFSLKSDSVSISSPGSPGYLPGIVYFVPVNKADANAMSVALKLAAKRLEEIGKGLS